MNNYKYNPIKMTSFKWFVLENFPFIEEDFDSLTNYGLYCKLKEYFDKVSTKTNEMGTQVESLTNAFIVLKDYVDNYFKNLDVQEEINNKLDEMVENGYFQNIISHYVDDYVQETNKTLNKITPLLSNQSIFLASFFDYDGNSSRRLKNNFYMSKDGEVFEKIDNKSWATVRDADVIYYNNKFYALTTQTTGDLAIGNLMISDDLVHWKSKPLYVDLEQTDTSFTNFAPEWFLDENNDLFISSAYQIGTMIDEITHKERKNFRLFICKVLNADFDNFELSSPHIITDINYNVIDPHIIKKDNEYYMFIKKEGNENNLLNGSIRIYKSSNLENWQLFLDRITNLDGHSYEAPCVIEKDGTYYLYVDNNSQSNSGFMQFLTSNDLINWNGPFILQSGSYPTRHGSVRKITNGVAQKIIYGLKSRNESNFLNENRKSIRLPVVHNNINRNKFCKIATINCYQNYKSNKIEFILKDVENDRFESKYSLLINRNNDYIIDFREYHIKELYSEENKIRLIQTDDNIFELYYCSMNIYNVSPIVIPLIAEGTEFDIDYQTKINFVDSLPNGEQFIPRYYNEHISSSPFFRIENFATRTNETSLKVTFTAKNNYQSFSCMIFGRSSTPEALVLTGQVDGNGTIQANVTDLTGNKTYTITTSDTEVILNGLSQYSEYVLFINDITYGKITFEKNL